MQNSWRKSIRKSKIKNLKTGKICWISLKLLRWKKALGGLYYPYCVVPNSSIAFKCKMLRLGAFKSGLSNLTRESSTNNLRILQSSFTLTMGQILKPWSQSRRCLLTSMTALFSCLLLDLWEYLYPCININ